MPKLPLLGVKLPGFIINALVVIVVMMIVNRVDFLKKIVLGG